MRNLGKQDRGIKKGRAREKRGWENSLSAFPLSHTHMQTHRPFLRKKRGIFHISRDFHLSFVSGKFVPVSFPRIASFPAIIPGNILDRDSLSPGNSSETSSNKGQFSEKDGKLVSLKSKSEVGAFKFWLRRAYQRFTRALQFLFFALSFFRVVCCIFQRG